MNSKKEHIAYWKKQGKFTIDCNTDAFNADEIVILEKWGYWFQALCFEKLQPFTMMQEQFIRVAKGEFDPVSIYEVAWHNYLETKIMESKPGDPEDSQYLPYKDTFYSREMVKKNRKMQFGVINQTHRQ